MRHAQEPDTDRCLGKNALLDRSFVVWGIETRWADVPNRIRIVDYISDAPGAIDNLGAQHPSRVVD